MKALFLIGFMGMLGSCGALECDVIGFAQCFAQLGISAAVAWFGFSHSDLMA